MAINPKNTAAEKPSIKECLSQGYDSSELVAKISECAYYKSEKRGFVVGHEAEDWYEAEKEVIANESGVQ